VLALPIANCGLKLEDEAVRVAVGSDGMLLGLSPCVLTDADVDRTWMFKATMLAFVFAFCYFRCVTHCMLPLECV